MAEITENKNFIHAFIEEDLGEGGQFAGYQIHTLTDAVFGNIFSEFNARTS